jgi:glycosyltransferase involved in cell wall biosynthesis
MSIAIDATPRVVPTGGIRRYFDELAEALTRVSPGDEILPLSDQAPGGNGSPARWTRRWWSLGLPVELKRRQADVFHGVDFAVPYLPVCPTVMTVHDLSPWMAAPWQAAAERVRRRAPALMRLGLATIILTPGETVRRQAIETFLLPPSRVVAVPLAASSHFRPVDPPPRPRPYFLYLGALEARKNLQVIVEAWREVRRGVEVDLVLAGRPREGFAPPAPLPGLEMPGAVEESCLPALYAGASAFLYPSCYEGFGLPVLEAMQCGAPAIVSRDPAVGEVAGEAAVRLDGSDARAWAEAMRAALDNPEWRGAWRRKSLDRARLFSWERTAIRTREVYVDAIRRFGC